MSATSDKQVNQFLVSAVAMYHNELSPHRIQAAMKIPLITAILARLAVSMFSAYDADVVVGEFTMEQQERFTQYQVLCNSNRRDHSLPPLPALSLSPRLLLLSSEDYFRIYRNVCEAQADSFLSDLSINDEEAVHNSFNNNNDNNDNNSGVKSKTKSKKNKKKKSQNLPSALSTSQTFHADTSGRGLHEAQHQTLNELLGVRLEAKSETDCRTDDDGDDDANTDTPGDDIVTQGVDDWQQVAKPTKRKKKPQSQEQMRPHERDSQQANRKSCRRKETTPDVCNESGDTTQLKANASATEETSCAVNMNAATPGAAKFDVVSGIKLDNASDKASLENNDALTMNAIEDRIRTVISAHIPGCGNSECQCSSNVLSSFSDIKRNFSAQQGLHSTPPDSLTLSASATAEYFSLILESILSHHARCLHETHCQHETAISELREAHDQAAHTGNLRLFIANNNLATEREDRNKLVEAAVAEYIKGIKVTDSSTRTVTAVTATNKAKPHNGA